MPSAISLLSVPGRLGAWTRADLLKFLGLSASIHTRQSLVGWKQLAVYKVAERIAQALHRQPGEVRLGARISSWYPPALHSLLGDIDPTDYDRFRFCAPCLSRQGYHSPLFQLPWWNGCPIHPEPLSDCCIKCGEQLRASIELADTIPWLACPRCGYEFASNAELVGLHGAVLSNSERDAWRATIAEYRRWLQRTQSAVWAMKWMARGYGDFSEVATQAVAQLAEIFPVPAMLAPHFPPRSSISAVERVWKREFHDVEAPAGVSCLGFDSPTAMRRAGRRFYGALPITRDCLRNIGVVHRRWRRKVGVGIIHRDSPVSTDSNADVYVFEGPRPLVVMGFRLLVGLARTDEIDGVSYLDFSAPELLCEPPVWLAQLTLHQWTGVDVLDLRRWPRAIERAHILDDPSIVVAPVPRRQSRFGEPVPDEYAPPPQEPVPGKALQWLYERLILEAWHDLALECFARAVPRGVAAWKTGKYFDERIGMNREMAVARRFGNAPPEQLSHPLLVHARAQKRRPRGWAAAVLRIGDNPSGLRTTVALLGRSKPWAFQPTADHYFSAMWPWPDGE